MATGNLTGSDAIEGERIPDLLTPVQLADYLRVLLERSKKGHARHLDTAIVHVLADTALLKYIASEKISAAFLQLPRWYE